MKNLSKTSLQDPEDTNSRADSPPSSKILDEQLSDDYNESSMDLGQERKRPKPNQDQDLKEVRPVFLKEKFFYLVFMFLCLSSLSIITQMFMVFEGRPDLERNLSDLQLLKYERFSNEKTFFC